MRAATSLSGLVLCFIACLILLVIAPLRSSWPAALCDLVTGSWSAWSHSRVSGLTESRVQALLFCAMSKLYRSALPTLTNSWTRGAAADIPLPQSVTLDLHFVACKQQDPVAFAADLNDCWIATYLKYTYAPATWFCSETLAQYKWLTCSKAQALLLPKTSCCLVFP